MNLCTSGLGLPGRLFDVSLSMDSGQMLCLVGPNGSGKTSLLHALAGIGSPSGTMNLDGVDPRRLGPAQRPKYVTYLPASRDLAWPLLAGDLIALAGDPRPLPELELDDLVGRRVDSLSTGERSRVLIARALVPSPRLLLLDEPTANLDPLWQLRLMALIKSETRTNGRMAILAIHDLDLAARFADRIIVMNDGRIAAEGLDGPHVAGIFGVEKKGGTWQAVRPAADPRSSP
jgi:iron complex transport system ATP-binding protein